MAVSFTTAPNRRFWQRECPVCGHTQMVPLSKLLEAMTCERCDYRMPARKPAA